MASLLTLRYNVVKCREINILVSDIVSCTTGVLYQGSAGRTDLPPDSKPWGPDTVSWIASMTKLASAISVLQIVEQGLVTLDEDVRPRIKFLAEVEILRGFDDDAGKPILEPNTRPITLRQLLTHTTGLAYDLGEEVLMKWRRSVNKDMINMTWTEEGFSTPLLFPPGTDWNYGTSIDWATAVLEKVTGQKLSEYMAEHILDPLEMRDTGFWPVAYAKIPFRGPDGGLEDAPSPVPTEHPVESGGAGLFSTTADYAKLLRAVLQGKLLSESSMDLLFTPQLSGEVHKSFINKVHSAQAVYASEYPPGMPINFGLGGMLNLENIPGKRAKGSMQWSGYTNPHWVSHWSGR